MPSGSGQALITAMENVLALRRGRHSNSKLRCALRTHYCTSHLVVVSKPEVTIDFGFTFGASATDFFGTVSNIRWPSDVNGVYVAAGAGAAVGPGGGAILLTNQNGALLTVSGRQVGLIVAADLNGLVITVR